MDAVERIAREAGADESTLAYLAEAVDGDLTDAQFRELARRELQLNRRRVAEVRAG